MRITTNTTSQGLKDQLEYLQREQMRLQEQIGTGLRLKQASDDPTAFADAKQVSSRQRAWQAHLKTVESAQDLATYNHTGMTDVQRLLSRAGELAIRGSGVYAPDQLRIIGHELSAVLDQVVGVANRQRDGEYLFGGTGNAAPVVTTSAGPPPVYAYNTAAAYTANVTRVDVQPGETVETGFVAGRAGDFGGFLTDGGTTDALAALTSLRDTLLAGTAVNTAAPEYQNLQRAISLASEHVGRSAARSSVLELQNTTISRQIQDGALRLAEKTQTNFTDAIADLQRIQLGYEAATRSGASILRMSLMNYINL